MRGAPVVSIELELDAATERAVRAEWQALADAGLSSLAAHAAPSNAPHVTLLVRSSVSLASVPLPAAFPVTLGAVVLFGAGDRRVLARSVVPSPELLGLHDAVHEAAGAGDDAPHTARGEWMPHVTLARRLKVSDLERALPLLGQPIVGVARGLRRWDAASATVTQLGEFGGLSREISPGA